MTGSLLHRVLNAVFPPPPPEAGRWAWDQVDLSLLPSDFRAAVARYEAENASRDKPRCSCTEGYVCTTNSACPRLHPAS